MTHLQPGGSKRVHGLRYVIMRTRLASDDPVGHLPALGSQGYWGVLLDGLATGRAVGVRILDGIPTRREGFIGNAQQSGPSSNVVVVPRCRTTLLTSVGCAVQRSRTGLPTPVRWSSGL